MNNIDLCEEEYFDEVKKIIDTVPDNMKITYEMERCWHGEDGMKVKNYLLDQAFGIHEYPHDDFEDNSEFLKKYLGVDKFECPDNEKEFRLKFLDLAWKHIQKIAKEEKDESESE